MGSCVGPEIFKLLALERRRSSGQPCSLHWDIPFIQNACVGLEKVPSIRFMMTVGQIYQDLCEQQECVVEHGWLMWILGFVSGCIGRFIINYSPGNRRFTTAHCCRERPVQKTIK